MSYVLKLAGTGSIATLIGVWIWLYGGSFWGGIALGALASPLALWLFRVAVAFAPGHPLPPMPSKHAIAFIGVCTIPIVLFSIAFRAYSTDVEQIDNSTLKGDGNRYSLGGVEWDGKRFIAVGWHKPNGTGEYYSDGALWSSPDGDIWTRLKHDPETLGSRALTNECGCGSKMAMSSIRHTNNGSLILGWDTYPDGYTRGHAWRLRDGSDSVETADDLNVPVANFFTAYEQHGDVELLSGSDGKSAMIWRRVNSGQWIPTSVGRSDFVDIRSVRYLQGQWFAVGGARETDPDFSKADPDDADALRYLKDAAVWTSSDGSQWDLVGDLAGTAGFQQIEDIVYTHGKWIAVGQNNYGSGLDMDAAVWQSEDPEHWKLRDGTDLRGVEGWQSMTGAAVANDKIIVVGDRSVGTNAITYPVSENKSESAMRIAVWKVSFSDRSGARSIWNVAQALYHRIF